MSSTMEMNTSRAAYHGKERKLYSRLVFGLSIHWLTALEILAFWLWLEEDGYNNIVRGMFALNNDILLDAAGVAKSFVEMLDLRPTLEGPLHDPTELQEMGSQPNLSFRTVATRGIMRHLKDICYMAFEDVFMRGQSNKDGPKGDEEQVMQTMSSLTLQSTPRGHGSARSIDQKRSFGEGSSTRSRDHQSISDHGHGRQWAHPESLAMAHEKGWPSARNLSGLSTPYQWFLEQQSLYGEVQGEVPGASPSIQFMSQPYNIPQDERTLFVTFSNGYPITKEELYDFFMSNYGDVEAVTIQEQMDGKPPLYAHVSFYSLDTLLRVLDGNEKMKFLTNGKHLWARRFIPKRKQRAP